MTMIEKQDILFDDVTMLKQLFGQRELIASAPNTNCDCIGYSTFDDEDLNPRQVSPVADQAD
jgi:hypothetical protein